MSIPHGTEEWYKARLGKITASNIHKIMNGDIGGWNKTATKYLSELAISMVTGKRYEFLGNDATKFGQDHEKGAIERFSKETGFQTNESGFILHSENANLGATPDCLITEDFLSDEVIIAQIKCPYNPEIYYKYKNQIKNEQLLKQKESKYYWQIQCELFVSTADYAYFVAFNPRDKTEKGLHYFKVRPNLNDIYLIKKIVQKAIIKRDVLIEEYRKNGINYLYNKW